MTRSKDPYLALERKIGAGEQGVIVDRWRYGRQLLADPKKVNEAGTLLRGRGTVESLIATAKAAKRKLSEREIQYRLRCAQTYTTEAAISQISATYDTWSALIAAGFPAVDVGDPDDPEAIDLATPPDWDQLTIPGLKPVLSIGARKVPLDKATVPDVGEYLDRITQMHESFGKTVDLIRTSYKAMLEGAAGDDTMLAVEAWNRGTS